MPLEKGIDAARLRVLRAAGMRIEKVERSLRADGSESEREWDVAFSGSMESFNELRLRADTRHVSLIQPRPPETKRSAARA